MTTYKDCPICNENYTKVHLAHRVCDRHNDEGWIVTTCPDCGKSRFSQTRGVCDKCLNKTPKIKLFGFNKNHRTRLTKDGLGCKENG